ncbi:TRM11 family SAM-dependent methyltransferase [Nonomuraea candida]|uniref:TRM11 family SAM-dependent methyltransferase n=1 Tax=Nonomuraea candida TaxID=359159 RepID=UPI0005BA75D5|nr:restriction endonuclease subunit M [Nonomuraea candida]
MPRYALLILPAFNRVYGESSVRLTRAELAVFSARALDGEILDSAERRIGGVPYVTFETARPLGEPDVRLLSNLSSVYAIFGVEGDLLRPLEMRSRDRLSSDLITIQKYAGKTNEHFTKLLLNVTALASDKGLGDGLSVFDPLCGRGTTLNQALMYGYDAYGIDVDGKDFEAYSGFIKTWLRNRRLKHTAETVPVRRERALVGRRFNVTFGLSKEAVKSGDVQRLTVVNADTLKSREFFKPRSFDVLATDAPYGVQHGSKGGAGLSRSPLELLGRSVPVWAELLRPGGAMGIAWNTYGGKSAELARILTDAGLEVMDYPDFEHWVDQAIVRDIIVARKPS